jgi:hypothetical protein
MPPEVHDETSGQGRKAEEDLWVEFESGADVGDPAPALDQDRYVNEILEEAARDLLKKYAEKRK